MILLPVTHLVVSTLLSPSLRKGYGNHFFIAVCEGEGESEVGCNLQTSMAPPPPAQTTAPQPESFRGQFDYLLAPSGEPMLLV